MTATHARRIKLALIVESIFFESNLNVIFRKILEIYSESGERY